MSDPESRLSELSHNSGVYLMRNNQGEIIYIGKARDLKKRVSSYFSGNKDIKTRLLRSRIHQIETIITSDEYEALVLENNLIKEHSPRYNISLKDGKSYPLLKITAEKFPRIFRTRRMIKDGSSYYGPFPWAEGIDRYLELIDRLFPLRKCRGKMKKSESGCLYYHIKRCKGPCMGKISRQAYLRQVDQIKQLLEGETEKLAKKLQKEMEKASRELEFEEAARLRDDLALLVQLRSCLQIQDYQRGDRDYLAFYEDEENIHFAVLKVRDAKILARDNFREALAIDQQEALHQFIMRYYDQSDDLPQQLFIPPLEDKKLLLDFLRQKRPDLEIETASGQADRSLMKMASENAYAFYMENRSRKRDNSLAELVKKELQLKKAPERIEGFDIAQLHGKDTVASMVSFFQGRPDKRAYRKYHIKTLKGRVDDYQAIREAVARRYTRLLNEEKELPDFILIDGGKGQVNSAFAVLQGLGIDDIPLAGLAKREELLFFPDREEPLKLPAGNRALALLQQVRDEAHRFATRFQKQLREKQLKLGVLEGIPGIGPRRAKQLLQAFGSLEALMQASPADLQEKGRLPRNLAEELSRALHGENEF